MNSLQKEIVEMMNEEDTFNKLKRLPFPEMVKLVRACWDGYVWGQGTGNSTSMDIIRVLKENGWSKEEFEEEKKRVKNESHSLRNLD